MGEEQRISWEAGAALAGELISILRSACIRLAPAGSLRRGSQTVGDVELVAISDGESLHKTCDLLLDQGIIQKRLKGNGHAIAWARRYKAFIYKGVPVDLFITCPQQWGLIYLIRTGPGKPDGKWKGGANQYLVSQQRIGGLLPNNLRVSDGWIWRRDSRGEKKIPTPEEADVFRLLGIPFIAPYFRTIQFYEYWRKEGEAGLDKLRKRQWHPALDRVPRDQFWPSVGWGGDKAFMPLGKYFEPYTNDMLIRLAERMHGPIAKTTNGMIEGHHVNNGTVAAAGN